MRLRLGLCLLLCAAAASSIAAQRIKRMEFHDQSVADILLALGEASGVSILPDETVSGRASFYFAESELSEALALFLEAYKLHAERDGSAIRVSRIAAGWDPARRLVSLQAEEVDLQLLVKALARAIGRTVLYDPLPRANLSVSIRDLAPEAALGVLVRRFPEYRVEKDESCYYLRKAGPEPKTPAAAQGGQIKPSVTREGEAYSIDLERGRLGEVLSILFSSAGKEYSLLARGDAPLESLHFSRRPFEELLRLVLEQGGADFALSGGVYYVFEVQRRDVMRKLLRTESIPLAHLAAQDFAALLPSELSSGCQIKADRGTNAIVVTGTEEAVARLHEFLARVDRPLEGRSYHRFELKYAKAKDIAALLPAKLAPTPPVLLPEGNAFLLLAPDESVAPVEDFLRLADRKAEGFPVRLKYLKSEELLKNPPPSVTKEDLLDSGSPDLLFFVGGEDKRRLFLRELGLMDRPRPQIRYQLLVVQYDRSNSLDWTRNLSAATTGSEASGAVTLSLSRLLSLSFDVVSQFGALFAAKLSLELDENRAQVFADTTLTALSGQEVKFQNTNTFRYREIEINASTGQVQYTGATSSITSGLIVGISGWVSGEGMITMSVNATVSKQGQSAAADGGSLPSTSEKVVATQLRTRSGSAVVIGGLLERSVTTSKKKQPLLGDIPLLGSLFVDTVHTEQDNEIVLYIVPRVVYGGETEGAFLRGRLDSLYESCVRGFAE